MAAIPDLYQLALSRYNVVVYVNKRWFTPYWLSKLILALICLIKCPFQPFETVPVIKCYTIEIELN